MKKKQDKPKEAAGLRRRAEERLSESKREGALPRTEGETPRLLHELQVHQIELEMQNEELRQSRAEVEAGLTRYTELYDFAPVGYFTLGRGDEIRQVNLTGARLLGVERARLVGGRFGLFVSEADRPAFNTFLREIFENQAKETCEVKLLREENYPPSPKGCGEAGQIYVRIEAAASEDGQECRAMVVDITDRKRMEERLVQSEKLRAMGEMAGGVAHDFNTALAIILGNTHLLLRMVQDEEFKDEEFKKLLKVIEDEAQESAQTVRRLLEFTQKGGYENLSQIDLNAVVKEAVEITKSRWKDEVQQKGLHIGTILNLEKVPPVAGVVSELKEVIANMIINAVEAMPGGGWIKIRTFEKEGSCVQISDSGMGMTEEVKKKVFEPFFTTEPFTRTGLGLSMSYGIVRRLGGEIEVESRLGQGTIFTITLPIAKEGR